MLLYNFVMKEMRNNIVTVKSRPWLLEIIAFLSFVISAFLFFPGYMSFDSLVQFEQVIGNAEVNNLHPPIMIYLWRAMNQLLWGPGGLFILHVFFYWFALYLFIKCLFPSALKSSLLLVLFGFFPPVHMISVHIWKDAGLMVALCMGLGLILWAHRNKALKYLFFASPFLVYALAVRHNAVFALLPVFFMMGDIILQVLKDNNKTRLKKSSTNTVVWFGVLVVIFSGAARFINTYQVQKIDVLGTLFVWDLAAISVYQNHLYLPEYMLEDKSVAHSREEILDKVKERFDPKFNYTLMGVVDFYPPASYKKYWLKTVCENRKAYLYHRWQVAKALFGLFEPVCSPFHPGIDENEYGFKLLHQDTTIYKAYRFMAKLLLRTPLYKGWFYFLLSCMIISVLLFYKKGRLLKQNKQIYFAWLISLSGLLYVLPLIIIAPSCEFRYIIWLVCSSIWSLIIVVKEIQSTKY